MMRTPQFLLLAVVVTAAVAQAQESKQPALSGKHRIVFEVTTEGEEQWTGVLNNVKNVREALSQANTEVIVVAHSNGLGMLMKDYNSLAERMKEMTGSGVVFAACENTMKKKNVSKDQLLPFATTTDSGIAEVVRKQEAGWSYVKSGS